MPVIIPARPEIVAQVSRRFDTPVDDSQFLSRALESAAAELAGKMRLSGKMGRTVRLHIACVGGLERRERSALRQPVSSTPYIADAVLRVFQRMKISAPVLYLTVSLTDLIPFAGHQLELFGEPPKPRERLQSAITTILRYPDAPEAYWINAAAPDAYRIEQRYEFERISAL
ncbi:MAG: hypothetical protein KF726_18945 [Anaerolineae bacterium]|nr:hypothetical protein [Anaerolineae bacterium]